MEIIGTFILQVVKNILATQIQPQNILMQKSENIKEITEIHKIIQRKKNQVRNLMFQVLVRNYMKLEKI